MNLQSGQTITIKGSLYTAVGIDTYTLFNQTVSSKHWNSFTLVGNDRRIGLTQIGTSLNMWDSIPENKVQFQDLVFNPVMSGIANISFEGEQGPSTPVSELVWFDFKNDPDRNLVIERFLYFEDERLIKVETFYYLGEKLKESDIQW